MTYRNPLLAGVGVGAGLTYFLDPARGARRRARLRDTIVHTAKLTGRALATARRDALHRAYGTAASLRRAIRREEVDDQVLVERVRAKLGRHVSHPHAIRVAASSGVVALSGPVLEREVPRLIRAVRRIRGVREVVNHLEPHEQPGNVPALQGGRVPPGDRLDVLQTHWAPTTRLLVGMAGAALAATGAARRDKPGALAALIGAGLVARAAANAPVARIWGVGSHRRTVDLQ